MDVKVDAARVIAAIRAREVPWRAVARQMLNEIGVNTSFGWGTTHVDPRTLNEEQAAALRDLLIEHLIAGEKAVRFYKMPPKAIDSLREYAQDARRGSCRRTAS